MNIFYIIFIRIAHHPLSQFFYFFVGRLQSQFLERLLIHLFGNIPARMVVIVRQFMHHGAMRIVRVFALLAGKRQRAIGFTVQAMRPLCTSKRNLPRQIFQPEQLFRLADTFRRSFLRFYWHLQKRININRRTFIAHPSRYRNSFAISSDFSPHSPHYFILILYHFLRLFSSCPSFPRHSCTQKRKPLPTKRLSFSSLHPSSQNRAARARSAAVPFHRPAAAGLPRR